MKKVLLTVLVILILVVAGAVTYIKVALPKVQPPPDISVDRSAESVENGKYLANHVTLCLDCHSTRDWKVYSAPLVPGTLGQGGELFNEDAGFPGSIYSRNITPYNLRNWTDGEIFRAITTGVSRNGDALFPVMPYHNYGMMDKEDIYDIIAYLRTLTPIKSETPPRKLDFPMNFILNTIPKDGQPQVKPTKADTVKYGAYLVNAAACVDCHTPEKKGQIIPGKEFNGGREFIMPNGVVRSANITPDSSTGIGALSREDFIAKFKSYTNPDYIPVLKEGKVNTIMPWIMFSGMDTSDLASIYQYLSSLKPVSNNIVRFEERK
ncbi:MAG: c-type cytochrome [Ginsengibacter sp.]